MTVTVTTGWSYVGSPLHSARKLSNEWPTSELIKLVINFNGTSYIHLLNDSRLTLLKLKIGCRLK